jgi:hypothetical protein
VWRRAVVGGRTTRPSADALVARVPGTRCRAPEHLLADGGYPMVQLLAGSAGRLASLSDLERLNTARGLAVR